jgi:predicted kinase
MRKWQRDRMRRRKKPDTPPQPGSQPEPLQPMYPELHNEAEPEPAEPPAAEPESPAPAEAQPASTERSRRRRGRGGRGRTKPRREAAPPPAAPEPEIVQEAPPLVPEIASELPAASAPLEPVPVHVQPPAVHRPPRAPRGIVVLAIGLPGSGKSSWFKRRGVTPLSSDLLRTILFDNITEQRYQDLVFGTLRSLLRARLVARMPWNYVDATNLSPKERHGWIKMAREFGYEVHAVFFDVPLEVCMDRNQRRARIVPEDVMQRMAAKLRPPSFDEGFSKIVVVRVKKREGE